MYFLTISLGIELDKVHVNLLIHGRNDFSSREEGEEGVHVLRKAHEKACQIFCLKVHKCSFENLPIYSNSYKNNALKISHS